MSTLGKKLIQKRRARSWRWKGKIAAPRSAPGAIGEPNTGCRKSSFCQNKNCFRVAAELKLKACFVSRLWQNISYNILGQAKLMINPHSTITGKLIRLCKMLTQTALNRYDKYVTLSRENAAFYLSSGPSDAISSSWSTTEDRVYTPSIHKIHFIDTRPKYHLPDDLPFTGVISRAF